MTVKPNQSLGPYRIIEQIGKGGMATVYRGSQPSLSRQVAIKVLPEFFAEDPTFHERFRQEAMAIASLRHSNILTVFDSGEADGVTYMVTELVEGGTLTGKLGKPLPIDYCLKIAGPVASALDYAHSRGMVHRDVKPGNILLASDGTPILSDFGLARMMNASSENERTRLTLSGTTLGTPEYMAPEQGSNSDVGPAADIYALAVILYEMLTGTVPYSGDTPLVVLMARVNQPLPLPREKNPEISEAVQEVLLKGLARAPEDRYLTAGEMVEALSKASQARAPAGPQPIATVQQTEAAPRKRGLAVAAIIGVCAVAVFSVVIWFRSRPVAVGPREAPAASTTTPVTSPVIPSASATPPETPAAAPATSKKNEPAAAVTGDSKKKSARTESRLPPHGRLLYSAASDPGYFPALSQRNPEDKIELQGKSLEFTAGSRAGIFAPLPVNGVGDFVAVMRYVSVRRRPLLKFRFHGGSAGSGHLVQLPASFRLSPASGGTSQPHACCEDFDMFVGPQTSGTLSLFTGPQPLQLPAATEEEQEIVITAKGPLITVYSGWQEIARASDNSLGPGTMALLLATGIGQAPPAVLRLNALEIYEGPDAAPVTIALPPHGKLLYSIGASLSEIAARPQQHAEDSIAVKGTALEFTAGDDFGVFASLPLNGIGDFVAVLRVVAVSRRPALLFRFHKSGPPGDHVVQLPAFLRLGPSAAGAAGTGPHPCCQDFDIYKAPLSQGSPTLYSGPQLVSAPADTNEERIFAVSVKGPLIIVYADGREIARTSDNSFGPGGINLQVLARGRAQFPAVLRLNALELYEAGSSPQ